MVKAQPKVDLIRYWPKQKFVELVYHVEHAPWMGSRVKTVRPVAAHFKELAVEIEFDLKAHKVEGAKDSVTLEPSILMIEIRNPTEVPLSTVTVDEEVDGTHYHTHTDPLDLSQQEKWVKRNAEWTRRSEGAIAKSLSVVKRKEEAAEIEFF